jgi:hypothetical protein
MNVQTKPPNPFKRRKPSPIAAQATGSQETFVRYVVVKAAAQLRRGDEMAIANARFPGDARLRTVIRATAEPPTDLSNTPALAVMGVDYVESLQPISAAAQVFRASRLMLSFDRYASISIPDLVGLDEGPPAWVASGQPAPVGELTGQATILEPRKLEFIITISREMLLGSNAEKLIGDALRAKIAFDLDKSLFDALPVSAARPAGLRSFNTRLPESTATSSNDTAMMQDVGTLLRAAEHIAGGEPIYFIARSRRIAAMRQMYHGRPPSNFVLLPSAASLALPESVLLCVIPRAVPSAIGLPEVELVESAAVEMDDAPGSPDVMQAQNVRSFFQSDTFGLKVRLPASWSLRHPDGANWITCLWPADIGAGGGGMPDAPADQFTYGRHQGAWAPVAEEVPATPPATGFARTNVSTSPWVPIENLTAHLAPLDSPVFTGAPAAPHPPPGDASTRVATTQFVRDAGGLEEVPVTPNGAYARVRAGANTDWRNLVELGVAPLDSPIFIGAPRSPTPPPGTANDTIATTQFVRDNAPAGGVEDVPTTPSGAYARTRFAGDPAGWTTLADLGVASLTSPVFIGNITVPNGTLGFPGIQFTDNQVGVYRSANLMVLVAAGAAAAQFSPTLSAIFSPLFLSGNRIQQVGDATAATDALNQQTADGRYVRPGGPALTDTLTTKAGTGINDLGLAVGDGATGFYRDAAGTGAGLSTMVGGFPLFMLLASREAVINGPLSVGGNRVMAVANPAAGSDALNLQTGDARYLTLQQGGIVSGAVQFLFNPVLPTDAVTKGYVDGLVTGPRAPALVFDLPADVTIPPNENWTDLATVPYTIPLRPGVASLVRLSMSGNLADLSNVAMLAVRIGSGLGNSSTFPERRVFAYGSSTGAVTSSGFVVDFFAEPAPGATTMSLPLQIKQFNVGAPMTPMRVLGGGPTTGERSQICVTDLGPV